MGVATETAVRSGDLVRLGPGVPVEFRDCSAVVTKVSEGHCTVAVLDSSLRIGIGECWPMFADVSIVSTSWREGACVVIDGLKSAKLKHLNGHTGLIVAHRSEGHPTFVTKTCEVGSLAMPT